MVRIIEGLKEATAALSRQTVTDSVIIPFSLEESLQKMFGTGDPETAVRQIIEEVRRGGDAAIIKQTLKIDGIKLKSIEISRESIATAYNMVDAELVAALKLAAERIRAFHNTQREGIRPEFSKDGLSQLLRPLARVGIYVPGGTASYPSTVLMTAIPARVAGVKEIIMTTPPRADGQIPPATLVAADIAGVNRIFSVGGASAIAALAYGTETIPAVDKICGPGNIFVALAKKTVFGAVAIDALQGPSDVLIIADANANPDYCIAELLAQAEHDRLAEAHLVTTSKKLADTVLTGVGQQLNNISRQSIVAESLEKTVIAVVANTEAAIKLANIYAPEHLCLLVADPAPYLENVTAAGCIVTGRAATVVLGDYIAGPSHALPTGGTARFSSPLNILDFIKIVNVIDTDGLDVIPLCLAASVMARGEGLDAHARAAELRLDDKTLGDVSHGQ